MVDIRDFICGKNVSPAVGTALQAALADDRKLFFPAGEYHFYPEGCRQKFCYFSNNDSGVKTVAILLENLENFTVAGDDARLIFHGRISPLCAFNCRNLTVSGLTVDFEDSFVSDADLIRRENGVAWFKFYGKHAVENGKISFTGDFYDNLNGTLPFFCYNAARKELHDVPPVTVANCNVLYKDGLIGLEDRFAALPADTFVVKHERRLCPGMVFDGCADILISNVTLHHAAGMGFLIQNSENCTVRDSGVVPSWRRTAVSDDALHITDCRGKIRIDNCHLAGTLDDSINVHGVFRKLKSRIPGGKMYYLEAGHFQQQGIFNIRPGDEVQLFDRRNGEVYATLHLTGVAPLQPAFIRVFFDENELPPDRFVQGDPALVTGTLADLEVTNTRCAPLNGRGVLASGLKNVHIAGCCFHTAGAGVFISGDYSFWYESGPVGNAVIENNFFDNCDYRSGGATQEPLAVFPELASLKENYFYHGKITVKNNRFRSAERPLVSIMSAAEAVVCGNTYDADDTYVFNPRTEAGYFFTAADSPMAAFCHCGKVTDENNSGFRK
ncbi:MAG: hypothetical protein E7058_06890 [Lentisphaerae bacterium]|nr:hypothetical protein [Lentisphaerota bacterium]